jgi:hypothetical protein
MRSRHGVCCTRIHVTCGVGCCSLKISSPRWWVRAARLWRFVHLHWYMGGVIGPTSKVGRNPRRANKRRDCCGSSSGHLCAVNDKKAKSGRHATRVPPDHLLLDSASNLGPLIYRWEINKFGNCWYESVRILEVLKLLFQQSLNLSSSQWDIWVVQY